MMADDFDMIMRGILINLLTRGIDQELALAVRRAVTLETRHAPTAGACWGALSAQLIELAAMANLLSEPRAVVTRPSDPDPALPCTEADRMECTTSGICPLRES